MLYVDSPSGLFCRDWSVPWASNQESESQTKRGEARAADHERLKEQLRLQQVSRERQRIKTQWQA